MKLFSRIKILFTYGPELESIIEEKRRERAEAEAEKRRYNLKLCFKHQQEQNHSHYSESNCDYCKLLRKKGITE